MSSTPDFPILGPPRITLAGFAAELRAAGSPAASAATAEYEAFTAAGVDPAVGLAIFRKESSFGVAGLARGNLSWGNIRAAGGAFIRYGSWTAGAKDAARLLTVYGHNEIRPGVTTSTVQTFPYVWAPAADHNAPDQYGDDLAAWIAAWQRKYLPGIHPPDPPAARIIHIAAGAHVTVCTVDGHGWITGESTGGAWDHDTRAPASALVRRHTAPSWPGEQATVDTTRVLAGAYAGSVVRLGDGVTLT